MSPTQMKTAFIRLFFVSISIKLSQNIICITCTAIVGADKIEPDLPLLKSNIAREQEIESETMKIIRTHGFYGEMYAFKASDGSILTGYHVINPLADRRTLYKNPVAVFHGIGGNAAQMLQAKSGLIRPQKPVIGKIITDRDYGSENLAFFLVNNNFDVWLFDALGADELDRKLGNKNVDPAGIDQAYWDFTLDDESLHHFPSQIDFVLAQTSAKKVHIITYSQSTFFGFALMSHRPEYNNKLASYVTLAPIAFLDHLSGLAAPIAMQTFMLPDDATNMNYAPPTLMATIGASIKLLCTLPSFTQICNAGMSPVVGQGDIKDSVGFIQQFMKGTSVKAFKHFAQLFVQHRVGMYDFGPEKNLIKYGSQRPPDYDLSQIRFPRIITVRGGSDLISDVADQLKLLKTLGTKTYMDIFLPNYSHISYLTAVTVAKDINIPVTKALLQITMQPDEYLFSTPETPVLPVRFGGVPMAKQLPIATVAPDRTIPPKTQLLQPQAGTIQLSAQQNQPQLSQFINPFGQFVTQMQEALHQTIQPSIQNPLRFMQTANEQLSKQPRVFLDAMKSWA